MDIPYKPLADSSYLASSSQIACCFVRLRGLFLFWWQFSEWSGSTVQLTGVAAALLLLAVVGGASREREHSRAQRRRLLVSVHEAMFNRNDGYNIYLKN